MMTDATPPAQEPPAQDPPAPVAPDGEASPSRAATAFLPIGLVFLVLGLTQLREGSGAAFLVLGIVFLGMSVGAGRAAARRGAGGDPGPEAAGPDADTGTNPR